MHAATKLGDPKELERLADGPPQRKLLFRELAHKHIWDDDNRRCVECGAQRR